VRYSIALHLTCLNVPDSPQARRFNFVLYENESSSRKFIYSGDVAVSLKDVVKVVEQVARGFFADYLSRESDPAVETQLISVKVHEVREVN
jgi:hypothetical protein